MLNNVRGFKTKEVMIRRIVAEEEPVFIALVETKLRSVMGYGHELKD